MTTGGEIWFHTLIYEFISRLIYSTNPLSKGRIILVTATNLDRDQQYLRLILDRINVCKAYKPKFGQGHATSLDEFRTLYGADVFYSWFGLDNPLLYAAHKAAGGITSLYRQIGVGCEQLFRQVIQDQLLLSNEQARWAYAISAPGRRDRVLSLDARIALGDLQSQAQQAAVQDWLLEASASLNVNTDIAKALKGAVFEVRQGYKSKDSKRQNADIANAGTAYAQGYLPVVVVLSNQIDGDIVERYVNAGWLLLRGNLGGSTISSTFAFCAQVLGYDLAQFFQTHAPAIKSTVDEVLEALLAPQDVTVPDAPPAEIDAIEVDELDADRDEDSSGEY
jgi:hypothetical protein